MLPSLVRSPVILAMAAVPVLGAGTPARAQDSAYVGVSLFEENVRGGGAEGASADFNAEFDFEAGRMCYYLEIEGLPDATGAAIHRGGEGDVGAEMVALVMPDPPDDEVCVDVEASLMRRMVQASDDYYVMVSNPEFPDGAVRGQLSD